MASRLDGLPILSRPPEGDNHRHGHERDHGRRPGLLRELPLLRGRHPGGAGHDRAPHARGHAVPRAPRPRAVHPPDRRHPQGRRVRPALEPRHPARRRVLLPHGRGPRAARVRRHRPAPRLQGPGDAAADGGRLLPRGPARALRRDARRLPGRPLARVLASELERESNERDLRRFNDMLRDQARGMGAVGRVAKALAAGQDARTAVCEAACEVAGAPVAFLLEPDGRDFTSTAMAGAELAPVTIQPRAEAAGPGRAFTAKETYFVADARSHPALAAPLVEATDARSAVFEPVLRDGVVAGVLIVIWRVPLEALPDAPGGVLRLLAAQAAVAIEHASLRERLAGLSFTDPLTGLATRRMWDEELPRALARRIARGGLPGPAGRHGVRDHPPQLRARRGVRRDGPRARVHAARADRLRGRRALGRRGAGRAVPRPRAGRARRRQVG